MSLIKAIHIPMDQELPVTVVEFDQGDYRKIQQYTGADCFAGMDMFDPLVSVFFDDEGKVTGRDINRRATLYWWVHRPEFNGHDTLNGDVLILGPADEDTGETSSVPESLIDLLLNTAQYRCEVRVIGEAGWHGNARVYDNWVDAYNGGLSLLDRWMLAEAVRVVAA